MDETTFKTFSAINNFVSSLNDVFGDNNKPLALYNRLISKTTIRDVEPVKKHINVFEKFLSNYKTDLEKGTLPSNAQIKYSERVFIDLPNFLKKSDKETLEVIKQHLYTIGVLVSPTEENLEKLEKVSSKQKKSSQPNPFSDMLKGVDTSTKEGEFVNDIMSSISESMGSIDQNNPMSAVASIMSSGLLQKMTGGLQSGVENGDMDIGKLFQTIQSITGSMMAQSKSSPPVDISTPSPPTLTVEMNQEDSLEELNVSNISLDLVPEETPEELLEVSNTSFDFVPEETMSSSIVVIEEE